MDVTRRLYVGERRASGTLGTDARGSPPVAGYRGSDSRDSRIHSKSLNYEGDFS